MASVPLPQHICLVSDLCVMFHGDRFNGGPTNRVRNLSEICDVTAAVKLGSDS